MKNKETIVKNRRFTLPLILSLIVFNACFVSREPSTINYTFVSKSLRSLDMSLEEHKALDSILMSTDSSRADLNLNLEDRKVVKRNTKEVLQHVGFGIQKNTEIVSSYCIDRQGDVVFVKLLPETTTQIDPSNIDRVLEGIAGYKVEKKLDAPLIEFGKLNIRIKKIGK